MMLERERMKIEIIQESEHFVLIRPPRMDTRDGELLEDLEFVLSKGLRPLTFTRLYDKKLGVDRDAIVCEKIERQRWLSQDKG